MDTYVDMAALRTAQVKNLGRNEQNPPANPEESRKSKQIWMWRLLLGGLVFLCLVQATVIIALHSVSSCSAKPLGNLEQVLEHGWMYYNYSLYQLSNKCEPWNVAREECKKKNAELVIINSTKKQEFIQSLLKGQYQAWVGPTNMYSVWRYVDGSAEKGTLWDKDSLNRECMKISENFPYLQKDTCMKREKWICEKPVYR